MLQNPIDANSLLLLFALFNIFQLYLLFKSAETILSAVLLHSNSSESTLELKNKIHCESFCP